MNELSCEAVQESSAEFALGILPPSARARVAAHLLRCPDCRREVEEFGRLGDRLLDLVPGVEPPLGFDRKAVRRMGGGGSVGWITSLARRRGVLTVAAAGVAAVAAALIAVVAISGGHKHYPTHLEASLTSGGHPMGSVYVGGSPPWLTMRLHGVEASVVTCQLLESDGQTVAVGTFGLVHGSGTWSAPEPVPLGQITGIRVVTPSGSTVVSAPFS
jgi:hypothetical protein